MRAITGARAEHMPIGELSRFSGVNIETIRYYERIRMLPAPPRTASGRRVYSATELRILAFIRRARVESRLRNCAHTGQNRPKLTLPRRVDQA
jgi:MerR family mercuric resistance operon transcriptional regulator